MREQGGFFIVGVVSVAARLTDKQKKNIIADRAAEMSLRQLARKYDVSTTTIYRVLAGNDEVKQLVTQKKKQNTLEMLEYMDSRKGEAQGIIDLYLKKLADPDKLEGATLAQIATALGIVVDKFTKTSEAYSSDKPGIMDKIVEAVKNIE